MSNSTTSEKVPQAITFNFMNPDPRLVQECRKIIRYGIKRSKEVYGVDFQKWRKMESECINDADYLRLIKNVVHKGPTSAFLKLKEWRMLEWTPEACVIKFGDKLFEPLTIAYAETYMPLSVIKKIRG